MREGKMTLDPKTGTGFSLIHEGEAFQVSNFHQLPELSKAPTEDQGDWDVISPGDLKRSHEILQGLIKGKRD